MSDEGNKRRIAARGLRAEREFGALPMTDRLGDQPVEVDAHERMVQCMRALDEVFNGTAKGPAKKIGIVLMVVPIGAEPGRCNYASNGIARDDIVRLFREQAKRFAGDETLGSLQQRAAMAVRRRKGRGPIDLEEIAREIEEMMP